MLEALELNSMSMSDKFLMMEELWGNMSKNSSSSEFSPQWHLDELNKREQKVSSGEASFSNLSEVKERLRKEYHDNYSS